MQLQFPGLQKPIKIVKSTALGRTCMPWDIQGW